MKINFAALLSVSSLFFFLTGCNVVGPATVRGSRDSYNDAIHDTTKEQAFLNIVRVERNDTMFFMDVTEVDATVQMEGQATTSLLFPQAFMRSTAGPFSPGHDYGLNGLFQYQESPTIRYQPLSGNALIAQLASPITVDSVASLYDSDWSIGMLLDLLLQRLAPKTKDNIAVLNAFAALDSYQAIIPAAIRSKYTFAPSDPHATGSGAGGAGGMALPNDSLAIYLEPEHISPHSDQTPAEANTEVAHLWARLLRIYAGTQLENPTEDQLKALEAHGDYDHIPRSIELRTTPVDPERASAAGASAIVDHAPFLILHSAYGMLREATEYDRRISFDTPDQVKDRPWDKAASADYFYTVTYGTNSTTAIQPSHTFTQDSNPNPNQVEMDTQEENLGAKRRYILIIQSDKPAPSSAFVSTQYDAPPLLPGKDLVHKTRYFYIDGGDWISQRNFALVQQLMTMQAIPSQSPQLTPSLTVGGTH
jgi:hypothetical protein